MHMAFLNPLSLASQVAQHLDQEHLFLHITQAGLLSQFHHFFLQKSFVFSLNRTNHDIGVTFYQ